MKKYNLTLMIQLGQYTFTRITAKGAILLLASGGLLCSAAECAAAPFSGNLKNVAITDAASANISPVAATKISTVSKNPIVLQFDASSSTDSDGTIVSYHWDFGNGKTAEGKTVNYSYVNEGEMQITLTIVDNGGAVALASQKYEYFEIADNFETDTSANYIPLSGGITVGSGVAHGSAWALTKATHKTALGGPDHWVQANVSYSGLSDYGGLIARVDTANRTGYAVYFSGGKIVLGRFAGALSTWLAQFAGGYTAGTYKVKLAVLGSTVEVYVNGTLVISKIDTTYPVGTHVGVLMNRDSKNTDVTIDNLIAAAAQ